MPYRHRIFSMVCADLKTNYGMDYEGFSGTMRKRCGGSSMSSAGIVIAYFDMAK